MKVNNLKTNYIYNVAFQLLNVILPMIIAPYISRVLLAEGTGIYSYTYTIANYFAMGAMLGITNYGCRKISACRQSKSDLSEVFSELFYLQIFSCIISTIFYIFYLSLFDVNNLDIAWIQCLFVISTMFNINWFYWGVDEFKFTTTRSLIVKIITFISIFIFVKDKNDLWVYTLIMSSSLLISNIPLLIRLHKYVHLKKVNLKKIFSHFIPNLILFIPIISVSMSRTIDKVMLGAICDYSQVGYYENVDKIINVLLGIITALGQVVLPSASRLNANGEKNAAHVLLEKTMSLTFFISGGVVFGLESIADFFVPVFFGKDFYPSINLFYILSPIYLIIAVGNLLKVQILIAKKKDNIYIFSTILGIIINITLNYFLINKYMAIGAAIATLISESISLIVILIFIRKENNIFKIILNNFRYLLYGFVMFILLNFVKTFFTVSWFSLIVLIIIGIATYSILFLLGGIIFKDDFFIILMNNIKHILRKKNNK